MRLSGWTQKQAIHLCTRLEQIAPKYGGHIALTGGLLYKLGTRKDLDILVYPIRGLVFNWDEFFEEIESALGVKQHRDYGWCKKASYNGLYIDFFDPMEPEGEHHSGDAEDWLS